MDRSFPAMSLVMLLAIPSAALAQTEPHAVARPAPANSVISPRNPSGITAGTAQHSQGRMNATVGGIDKRLLNQEKDRPRLPDQAPSPSQTLPGGTASGQAPH